MPVTYIVECNECRGLLLAVIDQKTRTCPFCGARVNLLKTKRLAAAESSIIASEILRKIKTERQLNTKKPPTQTQPTTLNRKKPKQSTL
jgi:hypothetical protein